MGDVFEFPDPIARLRRRLRIIGIAVLVLGLVAAWILYRRGMAYERMMADPSMSGFYKAETRQMGEFYGPMGLVFERFLLDLRQPGTQAKIIAAFSILVSLGCFYFAGRVVGVEEQSEDPSEDPSEDASEADSPPE